MLPKQDHLLNTAILASETAAAASKFQHVRSCTRATYNNVCLYTTRAIAL